MSTKPKDSHEAAVKAAKLLAEQLAKNALSYLEKLDRYDCQELLAFASSNWLLSNEDFRMPFEPPNGVVSFNSNSCVILFPVNPDVPPIDYRELHNLVRELTHGIYVMNQVPFIALDGNFDESTCCQIPPAYLDTRIGQIMVAVDYFVKCLWHGAIIPKEKRIKFSERWRTSVDVNQSGKPETKLCLLNEFVNGGLSDITEDPELSDAYSNMPVEQTADPKVLEERRFFTSYADHLCMEMHFFQRHVPFHHNLFVADSHYRVSSCIRLLEENLDHAGYERLYARLQHHEAMIEENLMKKPDVVYQLELLKVVSYLTPFLIAMKKRMKIPDTSRLLPNLVGDECRTERELPPLIVGPDFKCKNFLCGKNYFSLHGGIRIDLATEPMSPANPEVIKKYPQICKESFKHLATLLAKGIPSYDACNMLTHEINKKKYYAMVIEFETYYGSIPQKPMWVRAFVDEMIKMKAKRLPMTDIHIQEQFKKYFGYKNSVKYKMERVWTMKVKRLHGDHPEIATGDNLVHLSGDVMPALGLKAATKRGMVAAIQALCRKGGSRTGKADETGLFMMHYAAMYNRPNITAFLLINDAKVDQRRTQVLPSGVTPLHVAARCGSLEVAQCLVAVGANLIVQDNDGWAPIHMAAFFNNEPVIKMLVWKSQSQLELHTNNKLLYTTRAPRVQTIVHNVCSMCSDYCTQRVLFVLRLLLLYTACAPCVQTIVHNVCSMCSDYCTQRVLHVFRLLLLSTPLLLAATSGGLSAVKCLINLGAHILAKDSQGNNMVHLAALSVHINVLKFFIKWNHPKVPVWNILVGMMADEELERKEKAVRSLDILTRDHSNWEAVLTAGAMPALIKLLKEDSELLQSLVTSVLCNISENANIREAITKAKGGPVFIQLLGSQVEEIQSRCAIILGDLAHVEGNKEALEASGVMAPLANLLDSDLEDVLVNTTCALRTLCTDNPENQTAAAECGVFRPLVEFLTVASDDLQASTAAALCALCSKHKENQDAIMAQGAARPLVERIRNSRSVTVQMKATAALEALVLHNPASQRIFIDLGAPKALLRLLKVREQGANALWALAGNKKTQQKYIAEQASIPHIIQLLLEPTEKLLRVGCMLATALGLEDKENQIKLAKADAIQQLVRLLRMNKKESVQLMVIEVLGILCVGEADEEKLLGWGV
ncbi:ankyrin and armadillo repeat-containing protein-like [Babylonia areolata]|uniref:ankyrin and armadillo repeat-containing protein-like n=1 Tax=Babylonia areolata TaxID=304850 RepID=UPI003FD46778